MRDASCRKEDILAAFEDLCHRLEERRNTLWATYGESIKDLPNSIYADIESERWQVLEAGLAGVDAEKRMLKTSLNQRLAMFGEEGAVA